MANEEEKEKVDIEKLFSEVLKENLAIQRVNTDEIKRQVDLSKSLGEEFNGVYKQYALTNEQGKAIVKNARDLSKQTATILRDEENIISARRKKRDIQKDISKAEAISGAASREFEQINIKLERDKASLMMKRINASGQEKQSLRAQEAVLKNIQKGLQSNVAIAEENIDALNKELKIRDRIEKKLGVLGKLVKGVGKIPIIGEFLDSNKILKEMEETAAKVGTTKFDVMKSGLKEMGTQIKENMLDPFTMLVALFNAGFTVDNRIVELERSLGVSRSEAESLDERFQEIASNSGNLAINTKEVAVAFNALNAQIGGAATTFSDELLESAAELIKLNRLSEESAARFALSAQRAGVSLESVKKESIAVVNASTQERGLRLDINKVLDEAGKITGVIAAQLGGNIVAISKAISVAKQFGMELEQVAAAGRKLLDFESSISNELEAELLLGKQINLERARLAALTGDYETLTREINKNVGDFSDFTQMNILQQEALAASVGMTADQLSDVLLKQADIEQLAQEARAAGNEDLAQQLEKRSVQEQFNDTIIKLKALFVDIMSGPVMGLISGIGKILAGFGKFLGFLGLGKGGFADLVVQVMFFSKLLFGTINPLIAMTKLFKGLRIAQAFLIKQQAAYRSGALAINAAEKVGLIRRGQANILRSKEIMLQKFGNTQNKIRNMYEGQSLGLMIKRNFQKRFSVLLTAKERLLELGKNAVMLAGNAIRRVGNVLKGIGNALGLVGLFRTGGQAIAGGIKAGTQAPFPANVILPFILGGLIGAIVAGLIAKFSKGNDVYSGPQGGSGYGSRMLLAPEGAFSLNNRDTVIAGTDLFKANDMAIGGEGSINVNNLKSNNQQSTSNNAIQKELIEEVKGMRADTQAQTMAIKEADKNAQNKPLVSTSNIFNHQKDASAQVGATVFT